MTNDLAKRLAAMPTPMTDRGPRTYIPRAAEELRKAVGDLLETLEGEQDVVDRPDGGQAPNAAMRCLTQHGERLRAAARRGDAKG